MKRRLLLTATFQINVLILSTIRKDFRWFRIVTLTLEACLKPNEIKLPK